LLQGRDYILPDDVLAMIHSVMSHRLLLRPETRLRQTTVTEILTEVIQSVPVPQA